MCAVKFETKNKRKIFILPNCMYKPKRNIKKPTTLSTDCAYVRSITDTNQLLIYKRNTVFSKRLEFNLYIGYVFYVNGSVHHNIFYEITNRCSYMQSILFHC